MDEERSLHQLTVKEETYLKRLQSKIYYCYNCQPYEGGEPYWIQGEQMSMSNLLFNCNVPERYHSDLAALLYCPNCGTSHFDLYADVGLQTKYERQLTTWEKKLKVIHRKQVQSFEAHLQESPMLGLSHPFGRKIHREILGHRLPTTLVEGKFYRARRIDGEQIFSTRDMLHAPHGKPKDGRFNHAGQSHLYLSTEKETALREVIDCDCIVWVSSITLKNPIDKVLDLDLDWTEDMSSTSSLLLHALIIGHSLTRSDRNNENWTPDYYLTKFIMDCARKAGYNGIRYKSAKSPGSSNYVLFHPDKISLKRAGKPQLVIFEKPDDYSSVRRRKRSFKFTNPLRVRKRR